MIIEPDFYVKTLEYFIYFIFFFCSFQSKLSLCGSIQDLLPTEAVTLHNSPTQTVGLWASSSYLWYLRPENPWSRLYPGVDLEPYP